jgi:hypothetical protein
MKIAINPNYIPAYKPKEAARQPPAQAPSPAVVRFPGNSDGAAIYRVALQAGQPVAAEPADQKLVELLRIISKAVAERIGPKAKIATAVVWLSVDAKRLHDHWHDPDMAGAQRLDDASRLAGDALGTLGAVKGFSLAEKAAMPVYFVADLGDTIRQGSATLSTADLAGYAGVEDADLLKLPDLLQ